MNKTAEFPFRQYNLTYQDKPFRVLQEDRETWFVAADICMTIISPPTSSLSAAGWKTITKQPSLPHALARCIQSELVTLCHTVDRKVKTNDEWTVLLETAMPAVLVELAFLTNDAERDRLTSGMGQRQFAEGLVRSINRFSDGGPLFGNLPKG